MSPLAEQDVRTPTSFLPADIKGEILEVDSIIQTMDGEGPPVELDSPLKATSSLSFLPDASFSESGDESAGGLYIDGESTDGESPFQHRTPREEDYQQERSSLPSRSILKTSLEEHIPICTRSKSWSKLPVPNLEKVKMKRAESLSSFLYAGSLSTSPPRKMKKSDSKVGFETITIREYEQTIGDNPSVAYGTPISLDWDYAENGSIDFDAYEFNRGKRRTLRQMHLSSFQRKNILMRTCGFTEEEVKKAKRETKKVRSQRDFSKMMQTSLRPLTWVEEMAESAVRKMRRRSIG